MASDITSFTIFIRRIVGLIFTPYSTMRKISIEKGWQDCIWIAVMTILYFYITNTVRFWMNGFLGAAGLYLGSILFLLLFPSPDKVKEKCIKIIKTWSYTLVPTLIWFYSTLIFYFLVPPPRTASLLGQVFSVFYIAFSISLLAWKLILVYLSIRFSLRAHIYRVIYYVLIYLAFSIPLWIFLYKSGISRIPFV